MAQYAETNKEGSMIGLRVGDRVVVYGWENFLVKVNSLEVVDGLIIVHLDWFIGKQVMTSKVFLDDEGKHWHRTMDRKYAA
jgi:hypothetical protein